MKKESSFAERFAKAYKQTVFSGDYNWEKARTIPYGNPEVLDMPKVMEAFVEEHKVGCCLHYSWALICRLRKNGIKAQWAVVPEPTDDYPDAQKCVVVYEDDFGNRYVADVVEDVKIHPVYNGESCSWRNPEGQVIDNTRLYLEEVKKRDGYLRVYPENGEEDFISFWRGEYEEIQ